MSVKRKLTDTEIGFPQNKYKTYLKASPWPLELAQTDLRELLYFVLVLRYCFLDSSFVPKKETCPSICHLAS